MDAPCNDIYCYAQQIVERIKMPRGIPYIEDNDYYCRVCKTLLDFDNWKNTTYYRKKIKEYICRHCKNKDRRRYRHHNKIKVFNAYGNECTCCGEKTFEFLVIDHINNDGGIQRRLLNKKSTSFYQWIISNNFPDNLQILCYNCNAAKEYYGICPHKRELS